MNESEVGSELSHVRASTKSSSKARVRLRAPVFKPHDELLVACVVQHVRAKLDPCWTVTWRECSSKWLPAGKVGCPVDVDGMVVGEDTGVGKAWRGWHVTARRASV
jgi:hypothetical protein